MTAPKVLFISGSIGLGHATRDLAIADELLRLVPDIDLTWVAAGAAGVAIREAGGKLHPRAGRFIDLDPAAEAATCGYALSLDDYAANAGRGWEQHYRLFCTITEAERWDLIVGDETYEIWFRLHDAPHVLKCPFVMIYDFVGLWPRGWREWLSRERESFGYCQATDHRLIRRTGSRVIFVGEPEDIPERRFGFALPHARRYAQHHYAIVGEVLPFDPTRYRDPEAMKRKLGYGEWPLVLVTVGGTAVGRPLLELAAAAYPYMLRERPGLRMVLVCGPRIAPEELAVPEGASVLGYVPRLYEHFAAADLVITQGGGTTTAELTALRRPFLYFPLPNHSEQRDQVAVRQRRLGAGIELEFAETDPVGLARVALEHLREPVTYRELDSGGAHKAAAVIAQLLAVAR